MNDNKSLDKKQEQRKINTHILRTKKMGVFFLLLVIGFFGLQICQIGTWTFQPNVKWPYMYYNGDPRNSMGISCGTPIDCKITLNYGKTESLGLSVEDSEAIKLHFFELTNLQADTKYYWQLESADASVNYPFLGITYEFRTGPDPTLKKAFRFCVLGDTRPDIFGNTKHSHLLTQILKEEPTFLMNVGDIVMGPGITGHWDRWFYEVRECAQNGIPLEIGLGNHEWNEYQFLFGFEDKGVTYQHYMAYPEPENYYSFCYSNVAFISIDTNEGEITTEQQKWFNDTAQEANNDPNINWIIVFGHYPLYSEGGRSSRVANGFEDAFKKYNVDMYLCGHIHHYARVEVDDITYVVSGGGGAELDTEINPTHPGTQKSAITFQYCTIEISGNTLNFNVTSHNGFLIDECQLTPRGG